MKTLSIQNASKKVLSKTALFNYYINNIQLKLNAINSSKDFIQFLDTKNNMKGIQELFLNITKTSINVMQLRYIDNNGDEIIRIDRKTIKHKPYIV